jgi:hypothetical protein
VEFYDALIYKNKASSIIATSPIFVLGASNRLRHPVLGHHRFDIVHVELG